MSALLSYLRMRNMSIAALSSARAQYERGLDKKIADRKASDLATSQSDKLQKVYKAYQTLCAKPECAMLNGKFPRVVILNQMDLTQVHNAWVGSPHSIVLSSVLCRVLNADELRGILAHELAHILNGDTEAPPLEVAASNLNERKERATDTLAAKLLDYDVEPLISGLRKAREASRQLWSDVKSSMKDQVVAWDDNALEEEQAPAEPGKVAQAMHKGAGCLLGAIALPFALLEDMCSRSHPKDWARAHYLRRLAVQHGSAARGL